MPKNISDTNNNFDAINWITVDGEKQIATLNLIKGNNVYRESWSNIMEMNIEFGIPLEAN